MVSNKELKFTCDLSFSLSIMGNISSTYLNHQ